jgi:hypothetical protein
MGWLQHMEQLFPKHRSIVLQGSHHFPQEYDPASVVTEIRRWLDEEIGSGVTQEKLDDGRVL